MLAQDVSVLEVKMRRDENGVAREVTRTAVVVNAPDNLLFMSIVVGCTEGTVG